MESLRDSRNVRSLHLAEILSTQYHVQEHVLESHILATRGNCDAHSGEAYRSDSEFATHKMRLYGQCPRSLFFYCCSISRRYAEMVDQENELEEELEQEFGEGALEDGTRGEGEGWLGAIGNVVGNLLGEQEGQGEFEEELETELEEETGEGEGWLGAIGNVVGSLLGEEEQEEEFETEMETEQFFGGIGNFLRKAAPILKKVAKVAAPIVGTAMLGPLGGKLGSLAASALGEEELAGEFETEMEGELEEEGEQEMVHDIAAHELTHNEAVAEMLAESASQERNEGEAEAMAGAAAVTVISPGDRRALRRILPYLVRGTAILTRILRRRRITRPVVRAVPNIVRRTVKDLKRQAAKGKPITRRTAARTAAKHVRRVLGSPKACTAAVARNLKVSRAYKRPRRLRTRRRMARG
jgi:hypothetical protein